MKTPPTHISVWPASKEDIGREEKKLLGKTQLYMTQKNDTCVDDKGGKSCKDCELGKIPT